MPLSCKICGRKAILKRPKTVEERKYVSDVLKANGFTKTFLRNYQRPVTTSYTHDDEETAIGFAVSPYIQGVTEPNKRILNSHSVEVTEKPAQTLGHIFVKPKDPFTKERRTDVIYSIPCIDCDHEYIGQSPNGDALCKNCFFVTFETEVHHTIISNKLFSKGQVVAIGASGGKDSTVLAYVLKKLNQEYNYGLKLILLSVDEGITGYRDDSLETVKRNEMQYELPLKIVSYEELYGWTMDAIVKQIGLKNNCTFCGVFRRQALDRGAMALKVDKIVTGHNADDIAETVIMNILRGDIARLRRCTAIVTGIEGLIPRCKPFKYTYEKEIVMYAYFKKLDYFSTECIYSPNAYRGHARTFLKDLEKIRPSSILDIIHSGESLYVKKDVKMPVQGICKRCGYISSQPLCKACVLLEGLNKGLPRLGVGKTTKAQIEFLSSADCGTDSDPGRVGSSSSKSLEF